MTDAAVRIVYDVERVVAVDKPSGVGVEELARACARRLIHRIDQPTSGLVLFGDDARTVQRMQRLLRTGGVERRYLAIAHGVVASGECASVLVADRGDGLRGSGRSDSARGKHARTLLTTLSVAGDGSASLVLATLDTGRTHQIRIHLAERGAPIVGERVYVRDHVAAGRALLPAPRLLLHAWQLTFVHPSTKAATTITSPPDELRTCAASLGLSWPDL